MGSRNSLTFRCIAHARACCCRRAGLGILPVYLRPDNGANRKSHVEGLDMAFTISKFLLGGMMIGRIMACPVAIGRELYSRGIDPITGAAGRHILSLHIPVLVHGQKRHGENKHKGRKCLFIFHVFLLLCEGRVHRQALLYLKLIVPIRWRKCKNLYLIRQGDLGRSRPHGEQWDHGRHSSSSRLFSRSGMTRTAASDSIAIPLNLCYKAHRRIIFEYEGMECFS